MWSPEFVETLILLNMGTEGSPRDFLSTESVFYWRGFGISINRLSVLFLGQEECEGKRNNGVTL